MEILRLTETGKANQAKYMAADPTALAVAQAAIYAMIGGGMLGSSAIRSPRDFYIDARVRRRPYPIRAIMQAVEILAMAYDLIRQTDPDFEPTDAIDKLSNLGVF